MPRPKSNPGHARRMPCSTVIADEVHETGRQRQARQEARRQAAEAEAAAVRCCPSVSAWRRSESRSAGSAQCATVRADALAGRLIGTLEQERSEVVAKLAAAR